MSSDLTFITNEKNKRLLDRFKVLIKDTRLFDVLVVLSWREKYAKYR